MTTPSTDRTVTITSYGQLGLKWKPAQPGDDLDYPVNVEAVMDDMDDSIVEAGVAIAPSGAGEATPFAVTVDGAVITPQIAGGVAGRFYRVRVRIITASDATAEWIIQLPISGATETYPRTPPESEDFGEEATWMATRGNSSGLEAGHVLSDEPCRVLDITVNATDVGGWALLLNATEIPDDGAIEPYLQWHVGAGETFDKHFELPERMSVGAVLVFSDDPSPFVLSKSATATFSWVIT